jgi:hypothetical protein
MKTIKLFCVSLLLTASAYADIDFSDYHSPTQVDTALNDLVATYPSLAQIETIGTSHEGLPIKVLKISDNVAANEPAEGDVIFLAAHHAREWISVEQALYLAQYLLQHYATDAALQADMNNLQIWIVPIVNPDGVAYTWAPGGDRYWRKNRRNNGDGSRGVDLNRNYGYQWGLDSGSSPNTWDDTYRGPSAFSEPETQAIRDFVQSRSNLKTLVSYHSYSQLFLRPWSYTNDDPPGESTLESISDRSITLMAAVHGITYSDGIWYTSSGETTDYVWGETRTAAFTPELRPDCCGLAGFSPPPATILPSNEENLPAALALIHDAGDQEVWIRDYAGDSGAEPSAVWTGSNWSHAFWVSPDIWTVPETLTEGSTVDLHVRIRNATGAARSNVEVAAYWTDPRISLEFPNPDAQLIGSQTVTIPASGSELVFSWTVPTGTNIWGERHWCVGVVIKHQNDLPLTTQAQRSSNIGIRNFHTTSLVETGLLMVAATNFLDVPAELIVSVDQLPEGWIAMVPRPPKPRAAIRPSATERKARLLKATGQLLDPGETVLVPVKVTAPSGVPDGTTVDVNVHAGLLPLVPGKREAVGNGYTFRVTTEAPCPP